MSERPKNAWLITWEERPQSDLPTRRRKVVSILPSRTPTKVVEEVAKALFVAVGSLSLAEKFHFGLNTEQRDLCLHRDVDERFLYGSHDYLLARKVKNLRRKFWDDGSEELSWTEVARFRVDEATMRPVKLLDERSDSYRETANEEKG
jgi:hypothetical protein